MLTGTNLTYNYITLPCGHTFNYLPLYNEVYSQKFNTNKYSHSITNRLKINQIKCPYCRSVSDKLLPCIPIQGCKTVKGINSPTYWCMPSKKCQWIMKSGKNKGQTCNKCAFESEKGVYCSLHVSRINITKSADNIPYTKDKLQKMKVLELKEILREKGLRVGGKKQELVDRIIESI